MESIDAFLPFLSIVRPPVIVKDPRDELYVIKGSYVEFYVKAKGAELNFQWFKDGEMIFDDDGIYEGTDTDELYIDSVTPEEVGLYAVRVYNDAGEEFSDKAELLLSE